MTLNRNALFLTLDDLTASYGPLLKRSFWLGAFGLILLLVAQTRQPAFDVVFECYVLVAIFLIPSWLWATQHVRGLPIVPLVSLLNIMYVIMPILGHKEQLRIYSAAQISSVLAAEAALMLPMIAIWYCVARHPVRAPRRIRMLNPASQFSNIHYKYSLALIICSTFFSVAGTNGMYYSLISRIGVQWHNSILTLVTLMSVIACFTICLHIGQRKIGFVSAIFGFSLVIANVLASTSQLLLSAATLQFFASVTGYFLARGRIPWTTLIIVIFALNLLQLGKGQMRMKYWGKSADVRAGRTLFLSDYPSWYCEWFQNGWNELTRTTQVRYKTSNILERTSITQMTLLAQARIPEQHKFLMGQTYSVIPKLIVPRWINPNKPRTHEGQILLSLATGLQQRKQTEKTYIAWGMLAEAWANFGWFGPPLVGIISGLLFGAISAWSMNCPFASYRFIVCAFCFLFGLGSIQICASILVTSLCQVVAVITVLSFLFMRVHPYSPKSLNREASHWEFESLSHSPTFAKSPAVS